MPEPTGVPSESVHLGVVERGLPTRDLLHQWGMEIIPKERKKTVYGLTCGFSVLRKPILQVGRHIRVFVRPGCANGRYWDSGRLTATHSCIYALEYSREVMIAGSLFSEGDIWDQSQHHVKLIDR